MDTENILTVAKGKRVSRGWVKKVKRLRSMNWLLQNSHGDVKYSIGHIADNYVWCQMGARFIRMIT